MRYPLTKTRALLVFALTMLPAAGIFAHDTWLIPQRTAVISDAIINLDLTSGMAFPTLEYPIKPDRIEKALCRLDGKTTAIQVRRSSLKSLRLTARLTGSGTATIWVQLKPKALELTPKLVIEYLDEIGASDEIRQQWKSASPKRWREVYSKHAKTFVRAGNRDDDQSWGEPVGLALEIIPEQNPTTLRIGDVLTVRVLKNGEPLAGFPLGLVGPGNPNGSIQRTDAEGRTGFTLGRPGRWLLRGTEQRRSSQPDKEWESDFTTLTVEVR
ncbi:MAG: DUF4198 domain-containing protein [Acidobacteriota bacterium]